MHYLDSGTSYAKLNYFTNIITHNKALRNTKERTTVELLNTFITTLLILIYFNDNINIIIF